MMKTSKLPTSFPKRYRDSLLVVLVTLTLSFLVMSCGSDTVTEEQVEYTQGVITLMEEVSPEQFKIVDETVVANKNDSKIITQYLDGHKDTISLYEAQAIAQDTTSRHYHRHRTYYWGLMGWHLGRSSSIPPASNAYHNQAAYNRVQNNAGSTMQRTARRTTVSRPANSSKGYGSSSKSSRSYGG